MRGTQRVPTAPLPPLLGRDFEVQRLVELLESDTPVVVVGEAGVGKTSLVRAAIGATGRRAFEGGGFGTLAWVPFLAVERAIGRQVSDADPAFAARELIRTVGDGVLYADDLHWVDPQSRAALGEVIGRLGIVFGVRAGDPGTEGALAMLPATCVRIDLEPLDSRRSRRPGPAGLAGTGCGDRAACRPPGRRKPAAGLGARDGRRPSRDARGRCPVRLDALDDPAREAMTLLALAGHPMPAPVLGPGAGRLAIAGLAILDADGRLRVRHELIAAAAVEEVVEPRRSEMFERLARLATDPGEAARFYQAAGDLSEAHAKALAAADAASTPGERAAHLEVAAATVTGPSSTTLRVQAADALVEAYEPARAMALLAGLAGSDDPDVAIVEARAHRLSYNLPEARLALARGLGGVTIATPPSASEIQLHIEFARLAAAEMGDAAGILASARHARELADEGGVAIPEAWAALGEAKILAADLNGLDDLAVAQERAAREGRPALALTIGSRLVFALLKAGRAQDGRMLAGRLMVEAAELRLAAWESRMRYWSAAFAWHGGDPLAAVAISDALVEDGALGAGEDWYGIQALADLGRLDEARIRAERALADAKGGEYDLGEALWLAADVAFLSGRWADTVALADRHARDVPNAHHRLFIELPAAWATVELGRPATWPHRRHGMPIQEGGSIELEALRAMAGQAWDEAGSAFRKAAAAWAGRHARGERRTRWAAAECDRLAGRVADATDALLALEADLAACSEVPTLARTQRSLRLAGVRRAAPRQAVPGSPLTLREREILRLSGSGVRDGQIAARLGISRWAVVRATESAAAKLGASSRAEAVFVALSS